MTFQLNRRRFERFQLPPAYTDIRVRTLDQTEFTHSGHAYDISESGIRFELDEPIAPGTPVAIEIMLPGLDEPWSSDTGPGRAVFVLANLIWVNEEDLPGPVRLAAAFTSFARAGDRERLMRQLVAGRFRRAA